MIIITGAAGFIGSCMVAKLNEEGFKDLVLVDEFAREDKRPNYQRKTFAHLIDRNQFWNWIKGKEERIQFIIHLGARTDTTEMNTKIFDHLNFTYSQKIWNICTQHQIPLIYASSAATYGNGEYGFEDNHELVKKLAPLNPYGISKNDFDQWVLKQKEQPFFWAGLKFFNVYGPNEYHKGRMASVIFHAYHQITQTSQMKLFQSHNHEYQHGEQKRDFIYVKDVCQVIYFLMKQRSDSGLYNLGTGTARSFNDLAKAVFSAVNKTSTITYIPTPEDIRENYQYFTEANMSKLAKIGFKTPFHSLEKGVNDYVKKYLLSKNYL